MVINTALAFTRSSTVEYHLKCIYSTLAQANGLARAWMKARDPEMALIAGEVDEMNELSQARQNDRYNKPIDRAIKQSW